MLESISPQNGTHILFGSHKDPNTPFKYVWIVTLIWFYLKFDFQLLYGKWLRKRIKFRDLRYKESIKNWFFSNAFKRLIGEYFAILLIYFHEMLFLCNSQWFKRIFMCIRFRSLLIFYCYLSIFRRGIWSGTWRKINEQRPLKSWQG